MSKWVGRTSAEMREMVIDWYFRPLARGVLARVPEANSVILAVAQYWCDEASDAVHLLVVASSSADPSWPSCLGPDENELARRIEGTTSYWMTKPYEIAIAAESRSQKLSPYGVGDANGSNISAFAAYTREGGNQEGDDDQFEPYAMARRPTTPADDIRIDIVGTVHKPHLDGVIATERDTGDREVTDHGAASQDGDFPELQSSRRDVLRALERLQRVDTLRGTRERIGMSFREAREELNVARSLDADAPEPVAARAELRRLIADARRALEATR